MLAPLALVFSDSAPESVPPAVGANLMVSVAADPGFSDSGKLPPGSENPLPVTDPDDTVRAVVPVDVSVTVFVADAPTFTAPKATAVGLIAICELPVPEPVRTTWDVAPLLELLEIVRVPASDATTVGANFTWTVNDWPLANV